MKLPHQVRSVRERLAAAVDADGGVRPAAQCGTFWDDLKCGAELTATGASCAAVAAGVGIPGCIAGIFGMIADGCAECMARSSVCGWIQAVNDVAPGSIPKPSFC